MRDAIAKLFPFVGWLSSYSREDLRGDLSAGLTTAVMLIPQAMAYAMLAGLPPIVGLYASTFPLLAYSLFGSSRQLAVGPVAMVSLLVATGVGELAALGSASYVTYAVLLAAMVGAIQLGMGLFRAGFLVNFLSHPVVSGFTSAAALIIGFSQLKHVLGIDIPRSHHVHTILIGALRNAAEIDPYTIVIGVSSIVALMLLARRWPRFPRALVVVAVSTVAVWGLGLHTHGVAIVGDVPAGLPEPGMVAFDLDATRALLPTAITISLVGFMESISVAKAFARRNRYRLDANRELVGLGLANLVGGFFSAYPVTGGFSRTAVNAQAGARTGLAGTITAGVVIVTLLLFTPLFYYLPKAVLAAIIMTAVFGLVDVGEVRRLWRVERADLTLLILTFVATLTLGIEQGILIGVGASLLWFVVRSTRPHTVVLGRLPGTDIYRNVDNFPEARRVPHVLVLRIDAQFYFGNVTFLEDEIERRLERDPSIRAIVIEASSINRMDSSADEALHHIWADLQRRGVDLHFGGVKGPVRAVMRRSSFFETLGSERFHFKVHDAVRTVAAATGRSENVTVDPTAQAQPTE